MTDSRLTLTDLRMLGPNDLQWPVTFRCYYTTPWGFTQQDVTLEIPYLFGKYEQTLALGRLIWSLSIAPAISRDCSLYLTDVTVWKGLGIPTPILSGGDRGQKFARASTRESSAQVVLCTGDGERQWRRRFFFGGIPTNWADDNLLTTDGWEGLMSHVRGLVMGFGTMEPFPLAEWLVLYRGVVPGTIGNPQGVGFRRVTSARLCWHTDKAPELSIGGP